MIWTNLNVSDPGLHCAPALHQHARPESYRTKATAPLDDTQARFRQKLIHADGRGLICRTVAIDLFPIDTLPHPQIAASRFGYFIGYKYVPLVLHYITM